MGLLLLSISHSDSIWKLTIKLLYNNQFCLFEAVLDKLNWILNVFVLLSGLLLNQIE